MLDSGDHLFWLADADAVHAAIDRVAERMASRTAGWAASRLRVLVAIHCDGAASHHTELGAETVIADGDRAVGVFAKLGAADRAAAISARHYPDAPMARDVADTASTAEDPAIVDLLERLGDPST